MLESSQEKIVAASTLFSLFVAIIYYSIHTRVFTTIYMTLISLISIGLTLINLGCVINGGCTVWSWFLTLMVGMMAVVSLFIYGRLLQLDGQTLRANEGQLVEIPIKVEY